MHRLGVEPFASGMGAVFQRTKPPTPFCAEYPVDLQLHVYLSTTNRQTVAILDFLFQVCAHYALRIVIQKDSVSRSR